MSDQNKTAYSKTAHFLAELVALCRQHGRVIVDDEKGPAGFIVVEFTENLGKFVLNAESAIGECHPECADHALINGVELGALCECGTMRIGVRDANQDADPQAVYDNPIAWVPA